MSQSIGSQRVGHYLATEQQHPLCALNGVWLCWASLLPDFFSLVVASGAALQLCCPGFSLQPLLLLWTMGLRACGLQQECVAPGPVQPGSGLSCM